MQDLVVLEMRPKRLMAVLMKENFVHDYAFLFFNVSVDQMPLYLFAWTYPCSTLLSVYLPFTGGRSERLREMR